jgi:D-galactarolactone cycloisomerase
MAENGVRFIPHGWNTAFGLSAGLRLASAVRNTGLVEYLTGSPFIDDLVENPLEAGC